MKDTAVADPKPVELSQIFASSIGVNENTVLEAVAPPKRVFVGRLKGAISADIIKAHLTKRIADVKPESFQVEKVNINSDKISSFIIHTMMRNCSTNF